MRYGCDLFGLIYAMSARSIRDICHVSYIYQRYMSCQLDLSEIYVMSARSIRDICHVS